MALSIVGQAVGQYLGGPVGGWIGSQAGSFLGGMIDNEIFGNNSAKGVKSSDVAVQVSTYGHPINKVWGSMVIAGDLIWVGKRQKREKQVSSKGGFGGTGQAFTVYRQSFMVGISEPVCDVIKIWLDAKLVYDKSGKSKVKQRYSSLKLRFYYGGEDNVPDELIEAERGIGKVPAFKHLNTIMFEGLPLRDYGNRVPNVRALVVSKCAEDETHSVEWVSGFLAPGIERDYLSPSRTGQPYAIAVGLGTVSGFARFYRINIQTAQIEYFAETGYRFGSFGPGDTSVDDKYYFNSHSYTKEGETCVETTLTNVRTAMWGYPIDTFMGLPTGCSAAFMPPAGAEWMISGLYRVNQNTPTPEIYHASTGDLNHGRIDVFTPAWNRSFRVTGFGGFFDGPGRIRDVDGDSAGTIYALFTSDGQTTFVNEWELTEDITDARTLRWVPADDTIVITSQTKAIKISTDDGAVLKTLDFPRRINSSNLMSAHGNISSTNTLWFASTEYDASIPHDPSVYAYYPVFLEIDLVNLTLKREVHFPEAALEYPLPNGQKLFTAIHALYYPEENAIVAQDDGRETVGIFRLGAGPEGECPTLQEVVEEICLMTGKLTLAQIDASALADEKVCGFVNDNQRPARDLLEMLGVAYFFNARERDGKIQFLKRTGESLLTIPAQDLAAHQEGETVPVTLKEVRQQEIELPRDVQMLYFDSDRDYEQGTVQEIRNARVVETTERMTVNIPIAFTHGEAKRVCSILARERWTNRATYEAMLAPPYQRLDVLDAVTVTLDDNTTRFIRWNEINEGANGLLEMKGVDHYPEIYTDLPIGNDGGGGGGHTPPVIVGTVFTKLYLLDTPLISDADNTGNPLYLAVTPVTHEGRWGGADIMRSIDQGITWSEFTEQSISAVAGYAETALGAPEAWTVWDEINTVDVRLTVGELFNASALEVLNLGNAAVLGDEIIQFRTATLLGTTISGSGPISLGATQLTLTWEDMSANEDGFKIERSLSEFSGFVYIATVGANVLTYLDTNLTPSTTYYYRVYATNTAGNSGYSNTASKTTAAASPQPVPSSGAARYRLSGLLRGRRGTEWAIDTHQAGEPFVLLNTDGIKRVSLPLSDFNVRRDYRAITADMTIEDSTLETLTWQARSLKPYAVAQARVTREATEALTLSWVRRSRVGVAWQSGADPELAEASEAYEVDVIQGADILRTLTTTTQSVTYTTAQQAEDSVTADDELGFAIYQMSAAVGRGFPATVGHVPDTLPTPDLPLPDAPSSLAATTIDSTHIGLTWVLTDSRYEAGVTIQRSLNGVDFATIHTTDANVVSYTDPNLTPATLYYYRTRTFNDTGPSAWSNTDSDTTAAAPVAVPTAPSLLSVTTMAHNRIDGAFTDNASNESGFRVHRSVNGGAFTERLQLLANVTTFSDTGLTPSTLYAYKVLATNAAGDSAFSNTDSDTTDAAPAPPPTGVNVWFVSTSGNNANAGNSIGAPFRTIAKALSVARAGDLIYLRAGIFAEKIDSQAQTIPSGTSWTAAITLAAYNGETVTIKPGSGRVMNFVSTATIQYLIFDGIIFDANNAGDFAVNLDGVNYNTNIHHIRFRTCTFINSNLSGVLAGRGANFLEFLNCIAHDCGTDTQYDHGMYLQSSDCLIDGGQYYNNASAGIQIYTGLLSGTDKANRNVVRKAKFHGNKFGLILGSGDNNQAINCLAYDNDDEGIKCGFNCTNAKMYQNTAYSNGNNGLEIRNGSTNTRVINNISYANSGTAIFVGSSAASSTTLQGNITTDPLFVNAGAGDFHLQAGSTAIDAGTGLAVVVDDFDSNPRPIRTYDSGAFEHA